MIESFQYINFLKKIFDNASIEAGNYLGQIASSIWELYGIWIICLLILFFIVRYIERGMGSVYYYLFYFGIPAFLVTIFGWSILFRIDFQIVYNISFLLTGILLNQTKRKRSYNF